MNRILALVFCLSHFVGFSQITLELSDYFEFDNKYYRSVSINNLEDIDLFQTAGPNQTWDFTWLDQNNNDTLNILKADQTPYSMEFPNADFGISTNQNNFFYEELRPDGAYILGKVVFDAFNQVNTVYRFNSEGVAFKFPLNYLDTYSFSYDFRVQYPAFFPGSDSLRIFNGSHFDISVDAWGSLSLPLGTFDVLRLKQEAFIIDTVFVFDLPGGWGEPTIVRDTTTSWLFYAKDIGYRLLAFNQSLDATNKNVGWLTGFNFLSINDFAHNSYKVFPQPASDQLSVEVSEDVSYVIVDVSGKQHMTGNLNSGHSKIDVHLLNQGLYILQLTGEHGEYFVPQKVLIGN